MSSANRETQLELEPLVQRKAGGPAEEEAPENTHAALSSEKRTNVKLLRAGKHACLDGVDAPV